MSLWEPEFSFLLIKSEVQIITNPVNISQREVSIWSKMVFKKNIRRKYAYIKLKTGTAAKENCK